MIEKICFALLIVVAYLIGSVNASIVISKIRGEDIRKHGSGNAGATNMLRTYGKKMGVLALLLDAAKGILAVGMGMIVEAVLNKMGIDNTFTQAFKYICALFVVVGHNYPVFFGFKGGKGISTSGAVMFMMDWRAAIAVWVVALLVMAITKYVSLGSLCGAVMYIISPLFLCFIVDKEANWWFIIVCIIMAILATYRHRTNIVRLVKGTESKLGQKAK